MYLVSGGFRSLIEPVAELIGVPKSNVFANRLKFFFNGKFFCIVTLAYTPDCVIMVTINVTTSHLDSANLTGTQGININYFIN